MQILAVVLAALTVVSSVSGSTLYERTQQCASSQFSYNSEVTGNCCLPHGGNPHPVTPPPGKSCPSNWSWHEGYSCCVPHHPNQPPPTCSSGPWDSHGQCCHEPGHNPPPPIPSGSWGHGGGSGGGSWGHGGGNNGGGSHHGGGWKRNVVRERSWRPKRLENESY